VSDEDDEALTWAGGRDPSHYETPEPTVQKPSKRAKPDAATDDAEADQPEDDDISPSMSSVLLVTLGIFAGVFALYTVGWFVSVQRFVYFALGPLEQFVFDAQEWLAVLAAPLWFALALLLTRGRKPAVRLIWLLIGAIVLIPWPFVLGR
jgi:hypothetical protein